MLADGQASWTLHDPTRNLFFRIDWPSFEVLKRWALGDPEQIAQDISDATTLQLEAQDVLGVAQFLVGNQLTQPAGPGSARELADRLHKIQGSALKWRCTITCFFVFPCCAPTPGWAAGRAWPVCFTAVSLPG